MISIRPSVDPEVIRELIKDHLGMEPASLTEIGSGHIAKTFACTVESTEYIVQFNKAEIAEGWV